MPFIQAFKVKFSTTVFQVNGHLRLFYLFIFVEMEWHSWGYRPISFFENEVFEKKKGDYAIRQEIVWCGNTLLRRRSTRQDGWVEVLYTKNIIYSSEPWKAFFFWISQCRGTGGTALYLNTI